MTMSLSSEQLNSILVFLEMPVGKKCLLDTITQELADLKEDDKSIKRHKRALANKEKCDRG